MDDQDRAAFVKICSRRSTMTELLKMPLAHSEAGHVIDGSISCEPHVNIVPSEVWRDVEYTSRRTYSLTVVVDDDETPVAVNRYVGMGGMSFIGEPHRKDPR